MTEKLEQASDYPAQLSDYKICPLKWKATSDVGALVYGTCDGPRCAWWDTGREKCGMLPRT